MISSDLRFKPFFECKVGRSYPQYDHSKDSKVLLNIYKTYIMYYTTVLFNKSKDTLNAKQNTHQILTIGGYQSDIQFIR